MAGASEDREHVDEVARAGASRAEKLRLWLLNRPWFHSRLLPALPRSVRWTLRKLYLMPLDAMDRLRGRRDEAEPPRSQVFTGAVEDFAASGDQVVSDLVSLAGFTPQSAILDVGCGIGRVAFALSRYMGSDGAYEGLDIVESGIRWCNEHIAADRPNFHFTLADVYNKEYNPKGRLTASTFSFPYPDHTFDVAFLISVFTHLLPGDMDHYIAEIARVLKSGGRCYATFFLIDDESQRTMDLGEAATVFPHYVAPYWTVSRKVPELSVGYDRPFVLSSFEQHGLTKPRISEGTWRGQSVSRSGEAHGQQSEQDVVVVTKV